MFYISNDFGNGNYGVTDTSDGVEEVISASQIRDSGVSVFGFSERRVTAYNSVKDIVDRINLRKALSNDDSYEVSLVDKETASEDYGFSGASDVVLFQGCDCCQSPLTIPSFSMILGNASFYEYRFDEVLIPDSVEYIDKMCFMNSSLRRVQLSKSLRYLGNQAFSNCKLLESIVLPNTLKIIPESCLEDCESLNNVVIPEGVIMLRRGVFDNCLSLERLVLPESMRLMYTQIFRHSGLKEITLPSNVKVMGVDWMSVFSCCDALERIILRKKGSTYEDLSKDVWLRDKIVFESD